MKKSACTILVFAVLLCAIEIAEAKVTDCNKFDGKMEELVCEDASLSDLSARVESAFSRLKRARQNEGDYDTVENKMMDEQARWTKNIREECILQDANIYTPKARQNQIACLRFEYQKRLSMLNRPDISPPLTDYKVSQMMDYLSDKNCGDLYEIGQIEDPEALKEFSCRYFARNPKKAHELFGSCFGVGKDSFTPLCDPTDKIKQISGLYEYIGQLQHMQGNKVCQGAAQYTHDRSEKLSELMLLYDGDINPAKMKLLGVFDEKTLFDPRRSQLVHWSRQGLWEKEQYEKLRDLRVQAEEGIKLYYMRYRGWPASKAMTAAGYYTAYLADGYLGSTDASSIEKYPTRAFDLDDLNAYLSGRNTVIVKNKTALGYLLRLAVVNGYKIKDIERLLVDGAPVEGGLRRNMDTPLMQAVKRPDIVELLLKHGAYVNAQNDFGKTPLMYAIQYGNKDVISLLILHDADVNLMTFGKEECGKRGFALDAGGRTALMYAAWYGTPDIIQAMINHGANIHYRDSEGEKSYDYLARNTNMTSEETEQAQQLLGN